MTKHTNWYPQKAGNDSQGMVVDEETGRTVAVAYDSKDTALLAAAPELLEALKEAYDWLDDDDSYWAVTHRRKLDAIINKAERGQP